MKTSHECHLQLFYARSLQFKFKPSIKFKSYIVCQTISEYKKKILASSNVSSHKVTIHKEQEKSEIEKIREEITQLRKAQQELLASLKKDEQ
jgi:hypothetical protein